MAKSLEEHLYRSAKSKEEYLDLTTLKKRLQAIAYGLEIHRSGDAAGASHDISATASSTSSSRQGSAPPPSSIGNSSMATSSSQHLQLDDGNGNRLHSAQQGNSMAYGGSINSLGDPTTTNHASFPLSDGTQQQRQANLTGGGPWDELQQQLEGSVRMNQQNVGMVAEQSAASVPTNLFVGISDVPPAPKPLSRKMTSDTSWGSSALSSNVGLKDSSKFQEPTASQKKRVILQQQQRLLLLRHASKCKAGPQCQTKFCDQMVTLWRHLKTCRDKNCKTSHCLSSRCVLNHYRICKNEGKTSSCDVCGPVMIKIRQQEKDDGSVDPLTRDQYAGQQQNLPSVGTGAPNQQQQIPGETVQLQQLQAQQAKLNAHMDSLKQLQKQQGELLEQQKSLEQQARHITDPDCPQARQLQEKQVVLQELQKRCQQQLLLVQQELQMQSAAMSQTQAHQIETMPPQANVAQANALDGQPQPANLLNPEQRRRGSGKGKHFGKSLGLPDAQSRESPVGPKRRGSSCSGSDRSFKKTKIVSKPASVASPTKSERPFSSQEESDSTSLVACMTKEEIQKHLDSLNKRIVLSSRTVTHKCRPILQELLDDQFGWVFRDRVDPVALGLPDYLDVVKNPIHLELVKNRLENAMYPDMEAFARDTRLVFENAILYNGESSEVGELAQSMLNRFTKSYNAVVRGKNADGSVFVPFC